MNQNDNLPLKLCRKCQYKFDVRKMWRSKDEKYYCRDCFLYDSTSEDSESSVSPVDSTEKCIPNLETYYKRETLSLKRYLHCPKPDCTEIISVFSLESHFTHEHQEVPTIFKQLGERCSTQLDPLDNKYNIMQCIVMLNVVNHDFSTIFPSSSKNDIPAHCKSIMVLLVIRLSGCHFNQFEEDSESTDAEESNSSLKTIANNSIFRPGDKIIIRLASNINTNLSYTVAVSALTSTVRQTFFGPILPLGNSPPEVCESGNCLIMTHHHVNMMTEHGYLPLSLDFIIHSSD